jgi:hypothetical protein
MRCRVALVLSILWSVLTAGLPAPAAADPQVAPFALAADERAVNSFANLWARTDSPQARGNRSFIWGPEPILPIVEEPLAGLPGNKRQVLYWDKSRMEVNDPNASQDRSYVTNGLLVLEMVTGRQQIGLGADGFAQRPPASIPFGDLNDSAGPTYASFRGRLADPPLAAGQPIGQALDRAGGVGATSADGVACETVVEQTRHCVAAPFWAFLNSTGPVYEGGQVANGPLFDPTFSVTGLPITEAYWIAVQVGGRPTRVLIQLFERRTLTYNPANAAGAQVEMGNVGLQYYHWRYDATLAEESGLDPAMRAGLRELNGASQLAGAPNYGNLVGNLTGERSRWQLLFQDLSGTGAEALTIPAYRAILFDNRFRDGEPRNLAGVLGHEGQHAYDNAVSGGDRSANECYAIELRGFLVGASLWQAWYGPAGKPNPASAFERTENEVLALIRGDPARFARVLIQSYREQCANRGPGGPERYLTLDGLPAGIERQLPVQQSFDALRSTLSAPADIQLETLDAEFILPRR